jgi:putative DNA primase/helicase
MALGFAVFEQAATTLAEAVAGQWRPKNVMVDRLVDIAEAHSFFGRDRGEIHGTIAEHSAKLPAPITSVILPPLSSLLEKLPRRLISQHASDLKPERLV